MKLGPDLIPHFVQYQANKTAHLLTMTQRQGFLDALFAKSKFPKGKLCELLESLTLEMNFHSLIFLKNSCTGGITLCT